MLTKRSWLEVIGRDDLLVGLVVLAIIASSRHHAESASIATIFAGFSAFHAITRTRSGEGYRLSILTGVLLSVALFIVWYW